MKDELERLDNSDEIPRYSECRKLLIDAWRSQQLIDASTHLLQGLEVDVLPFSDGVKRRLRQRTEDLITAHAQDMYFDSGRDLFYSLVGDVEVSFEIIAHNVILSIVAEDDDNDTLGVQDLSNERIIDRFNSFANGHQTEYILMSLEFSQSESDTSQVAKATADRGLFLETKLPDRTDAYSKPLLNRTQVAIIGGLLREAGIIHRNATNRQIAIGLQFMTGFSSKHLENDVGGRNSPSMKLTNAKSQLSEIIEKLGIVVDLLQSELDKIH